MKTLLTSIFLSILFLCPVEAKSQTLEGATNGTIQSPNSTVHIGTFNGIDYVCHRGQFVGTTQGGRFVVPYEITVPFNPAEGRSHFILEPPHSDGGPVAREVYLGPSFLFTNGFSHASVGFGNRGQRLLDSNSSFTPVIKGTPIVAGLDQSKEVTDIEILQQFALALKETRLPFPAQVERLYAVGFSDSGNVVREMYGAFGHKLFDLSIVCTTSDSKPAQIHGENPIFIAGGPHVPDVGTQHEFGETDEGVAGTTPINWLPFIRALLITPMRD